MRRTSKILALAGVSLAFALTAVFLAFGSGLARDLSGGLVQAAPPTERPNIILILTDDLDAESVEYMPELKSLLGEEGTTFENAFVTTSICCPSRSSILTGQYAHNHRVLKNAKPLGGFQKFDEMGHEDSTVATWLQSAGYRSVLLGKYLNGYGEKDPTHVPPGWDEWYGRVDGDYYYDLKLNENGEIVSYGDDEEDYYTDVLARKANDYVRRAVEDPAPFFMYLAPLAPHYDYTPAPRHKEAFADEKAPRPPSFNEDDTSDKPPWVREKPRLDSEKIEEIDDAYRNRLRTLLAVDEMISGLVETLRESDELDNTYIVFTSDNGYHLGQHRLRPHKDTAYEEDIHVPHIVRGPNVPAGQALDQFALNIDLAPTFAEWGGATAPDTADGRSLAPLLSGDTPPATWRTGFLVEHWGEGIQTHKALRTEEYKYVRYDDGDRELYNIRSDPYELESVHDSVDPALEEQLESRIDALEKCAGESCNAAEDEPPG